MIISDVFQSDAWVEVVYASGQDLKLTYRVPESLAEAWRVGAMVQIQIRQQKTWGLVVGVGCGPTPWGDLKPILGVSPWFLKAEHRVFWEWLAQYYMSHWNRVLDVVLPGDWWKWLEVEASRFPKIPSQKPLPPLNFEQSQAFEIFLKQCEKNSQSPFLLHGVTGSGKTRLMVEMALAVLKQGKNVLWLVPEIGLTPQTHLVLSGWFPEIVDLLHSGLAIGPKRRTWQRILREQTRILIGTRSALLAPYSNLGLILVDEEHDASYKQSDPSPRYHARDAALWRGRQLSIPVVLASATPSLEMFLRVRQKRLIYMELRQRAMTAVLPKIHLIDRRKDPQSRDWLLGSDLRTAIGQTLAKSEQIILLHNRRGYAKSRVCGACGQVQKCVNCDVSMTLHLKRKKMICHHCDAQVWMERPCSHCGSQDWIEQGGAIEKVEEELQFFFPNVKVLRLDRDSVTKKGALADTLESFRSGEASILLGTQMVVKGHDFPKVTLVGVISADQALQSPDFRAGEQAFQLLTQVAGRAGRSELPGEVYWQTWNPGDPTLQLALKQDYTAFAEHEFKQRHVLFYPPWSRLIKIECAGRDPSGMRQWLVGFVQEIKKFLGDKARVLGPSEAPIFMLRKDFRFQILIFSSDPLEVSSAIQQVLRAMPCPKVWKLHMDVDAREF
jgi:primosomal protein N' (replication factor Y)